MVNRFQVLRYNKKYISLMNVHLEKENVFFKSFLRCIILFLAISFPISAMTYAYKSWPQLEIVSASAIIGFGGLLSSGMFISFWLNFNTVKIVHARLQQIIDEEGEIKRVFKMHNIQK